MNTVAELLRDATGRLRVAGIESPRLDARLLLAHAMGVEASHLITLSPTCVGEREILYRFESFLARRIAHEPVAYIVGRKEFWSLDFAVGPGVLIPRPETETLIEQAIARFADRQAPLDVLDLGTGSGCLLIAFLAAFPNARGTGIDASESALAWARRNVERHGLEPRCRLEIGTWAENFSGRFDVILSNPPYIESGVLPALPPDVGLHEPVAALDGGADGLDAYRALAPQIERILAPDGLVFLEIGADQGEAVAAILAAYGLEMRHIAPDLAGLGRCVVAGHKTEILGRGEKTVGKTGPNR